MMKPVYIYALRDPDSGDIFYVGKSLNPKTRYRSHFKSARLLSNRLLCERVRAMRENGATPLLTILQVSDDNSWRGVERSWIAFLRSKGVILENISPGGDGSNDGHRGPFRDSKERGKRIRIAWWEWWNSLTPEEKVVQQKLRVMTKAGKEKLSRDRKGVPQAESHRLAVMASKRTPEFHLKASLSQKKVWASMSVEQREVIVAKRRAASSAIWASLDEDGRRKRLSGICPSWGSRSSA